MTDRTDRQKFIEDILGLDSTLQQVLRNSWPEAWLQVNLPVGSTRALFAIEGRGARTPGKVAEALGVSRTTVTGLLDRLEGEGLLTRSIDPADRRSLVLELTPKARDFIAQMEAHRRARLSEALAQMPNASLESLHAGLAELVTLMREQEQAQGQQVDSPREAAPAR